MSLRDRLNKKLQETDELERVAVNHPFKTFLALAQYKQVTRSLNELVKNGDSLPKEVLTEIIILNAIYEELLSENESEWT